MTMDLNFNKEKRERLQKQMEWLHSEGFNIFNLKLLAKSYVLSSVSLRGVALYFGDLQLRIGPQTEETPVFTGLSLVRDPGRVMTIKTLENIGLNPYAVRAFIAEFAKSKLTKKGLHVTIDDVRFLIGPQRDPLVIRFDEGL